ncbi:hypothetical protein PMSD_28055 [Paenibacillus macquariensis subsp. defensor]|nr:hypothetical protein PMSD_28055 [Paenibacillus macquariensis subsp. defensor]
MVTINNVIDGVILKLSQSFPSATIYEEEIKQGLVEPCFFVKLFPVAQDKEFGRRYKRYHTFDVHYFPLSTEDANVEMHDVAEKLYDVMEWISIGLGSHHGSKMTHEIIDGVLPFSVSYPVPFFAP